MKLVDLIYRRRHLAKAIPRELQLLGMLAAYSCPSYPITKLGIHRPRPRSGYFPHIAKFRASVFINLGG